MPSVFISYRREDCPGHAGRLFDHLRARFGGASVFMDVTDIEAGVDFVDVLHRAVGSCDVLLAVVGREWLACTDRNGRRRLDDPQDFIRLEIGIALNRNVRVIPVLVEGAAMPAASDLPPDLQGLTRRQAVELRDARWNADVENLADVLNRVLGPVTPAMETTVTRPRRGRAMFWGVAAVALVATLAGLATLVPRGGSTPPAPSAQAVPSAQGATTAPPTSAPPGPEVSTNPAPDAERQASAPGVSGGATRGTTRPAGRVAAGSSGAGSNAPSPGPPPGREQRPEVVPLDARSSSQATNSFLGVRVANPAADSSGAAARGAIVQSLAPGGPAASAGLMVGDVIVEYGGTQVSDAASFSRLAAGSAPGETVLIRVRRGGAGRTLEAVVGDRADAPAARGTVLIHFPVADDSKGAEDLAKALRESINDARYAVRTFRTARSIGSEGEIRYSAPDLSALAGTLARRAESSLSQMYGRRVTFTQVVDPRVVPTGVIVVMPGRTLAEPSPQRDPIVNVVYQTVDDAKAAEDLVDFLRTLRSGWKYSVRALRKTAGAKGGQIEYENERMGELARVLSRDSAAWLSRAYGRRVELQPTPGSRIGADSILLWLPTR